MAEPKNDYKFVSFKKKIVFELWNYEKKCKKQWKKVVSKVNWKCEKILVSNDLLIIDNCFLWKMTKKIKIVKYTKYKEKKG